MRLTPQDLGPDTGHRQGRIREQGAAKKWVEIPACLPWHGMFMANIQMKLSKKVPAITKFR